MSIVRQFLLPFRYLTSIVSVITKFWGLALLLYLSVNAQIIS